MIKERPLVWIGALTMSMLIACAQQSNGRTEGASDVDVAHDDSESGAPRFEGVAIDSAGQETAIKRAGRLHGNSATAAARLPTPPPGAASSDWLATVQASIVEGTYRVHQDDARLTATTRAQNLAIAWDEEGTRVERSDGSDSLSVRLRTVGWGRGGRWFNEDAGHSFLEPMIGACRTDGALDELGSCLARVERSLPGLLEVWENRREGLEQIFEVEAPPEQFVHASDPSLAQETRPLFILIEIEGTDVEIEPGARGALLSSEEAGLLQYDGLEAWDARGESLFAWMEAAPGGIAIYIDDSEAVWPITVDPILTSVAWRVESNQSSAYFGGSVASAGDVNGDGYGDIILVLLCHKIRGGGLFLGGSRLRSLRGARRGIGVD